jgi:hypothetical protein
MSIDLATFSVILSTFCLMLSGRFFQDFAALYEKLFLRKFVLGFSRESWQKLLLKLYVLTGIYCVQRFYLSNMLHIFHLRSFVSLCGLTVNLVNDYPAE